MKLTEEEHSTLKWEIIDPLKLSARIKESKVVDISIMDYPLIDSIIFYLKGKDGSITAVNVKTTQPENSYIALDTLDIFIAEVFKEAPPKGDREA